MQGHRTRVSDEETEKVVAATYSRPAAVGWW
jgi:hypothetical protein